MPMNQTLQIRHVFPHLPHTPQTHPDTDTHRHTQRVQPHNPTTGVSLDSTQRLGADDLPGPGLVLGSWVQVGDHHLHCLDLLVLGRDGAHLVRDFISFHGHVFPINTVRGDREEHAMNYY